MLKSSKTLLAGVFLTTGLLMCVTGGRASAAVDGEQVYQFYCAQCHGAGGKGDGPNVTPSMPVTPRNFTKQEDMNKLSDLDIQNVIMEGGPALSKSPMMPPWSQTLSKDEVAAMVAHLRKLCDCKGKQ
ncbi:MAG: cytochrome c [Magnetococcus sp. YQC-5]